MSDNTMPYVTRTRCRSCDSRDLVLVLDYGQMPLAGGFFEADDPRSQQKYPMHLVRCQSCTLMQVAETIQPSLIFSNYSYSSSVNRTLVTHYEKFASLIAASMAEGQLLVEFGCNDGVLLNPLSRLGVKVIGVDPSDVAIKASESNGWRLIPDYFSIDVARNIASRHGEADVVVANNVCAHVDDPNVLIEGVSKLLSSNGRFIFEVHYQGDLLATNQYDTVYHEHTCYYSIVSLRGLLERHGLRIVDVQRIPTHCGSIRVTATPWASDLISHESIAELISREAQFDASKLSEFAPRHSRMLYDLLYSITKSGKRIVAYGASGRATVLLNYCKLGPDLIDHVSDLSPLRFNRVIPGVQIPIRSRNIFRDNYPDYVLITAWNYEAEILEDEQDYAKHGNAFLIPLPSIRII